MHILMRPYCLHKLAMAVAVAVAVTACGERDFGQATPEAAGEYAELIDSFRELQGEEWVEEELNSAAEVTALMTHFDKTADARYATPQSGLTMLHLACLFKKPELARCLLLDGANPNARTKDAYGMAAGSPLSFAISPGFYDTDTEAKILQLVDLLIKNGAQTSGAIWHDLGPLAGAAHVCAHESIAQHLLKHVTHVTADDMRLIIERGWANLLHDILAQKGELTEEEKESIVTACYIIKGHYDGKINSRMVELFLSKGVDINTFDAMDSTPLIVAASHLSFAEDEQFRSAWIDFIAYLLSKGADINLVAGPQSPHAGLCAYDILANHNGVLEALAERGQALIAPPLVIREGDTLIDDLNRAGMRKMSAEAAQPYLQQITSIFTPTQEQLQNRGFNTALLSAAEILQRVGADYAAQVINDSSIWDITPHLHEMEHIDIPCEHITAASLIYILQDVKEVKANTDKILKVAQQAIHMEDYDLAANAIELLGRDSAAADKVEELLKFPHLSIQAGAWGAKLAQMGLPRCTNGAVKNWLAAHGREADTPAIKTALLATSLEEMWYGNMTAERKKEFIRALEAIGAPTSAIKVYGDYADSMDNPDKLDALEALGSNWRYELEIATARYILQHATDFLPQSDTK